MSNQRKRIFLCVAAMLQVFIGCEKESAKFPTIQVYAVGIREPQTIQASEAKIPDHKTVIGVRVGEKARAYLVDALKPQGMVYSKDASPAELQELGKHVVNDLIDGQPISVTHCDMNGCSRVFSGDGDDSLDIAVAGTRDGQLELSLMREKFLQNAINPPVESYPFEIATWEEWKSANPETDLYVGDLSNVGHFDPPNAGRPVLMN